MTHQLVATNKSACLVFAGMINADYATFLIYKEQKARHQLKIGCTANYPYHSLRADQTLIGAALGGGRTSGPPWFTCTDRHGRCQRNNHGEVGEMHCLCVCVSDEELE
jgi:hypothetical protein